MRVLVVDDTVVFRNVVSEALAGIPDVEVVGSAANGRLALSRINALQPDLITLDLEMPEMNGIEVLERIKSAATNTGAIILSAHTVHGGELTVRALELGAFDFLTKPDRGTPQENMKFLRDGLRPLIQAFARKHRKPSEPPEPAALSRPTRPAEVTKPASAVVRIPRRAGTPIVLIGVSTGGPAALTTLLPALPANIEAPVFIVQHMPPLFTKPLALSLSGKSKMRVKEAEDGERSEPGCAYLAPGGKQMKLTRGPAGDVVIRITDDPPENNCKPAVDYLFRSAALEFPGRSIAVVLTGMGCDGTAGLRLLKRGGCVSIAQDEASCVVYGMPKEAIHAGVVDVVHPLERIAGAIVRAIGEART
jgi:two-component system chemotaxis response regulator CheB